MVLAGAFALQPPHAAETSAATPVLAQKAAPPDQAMEAAGSRRASDASSVASVCSLALACAPTGDFKSRQTPQHNLLFEDQQSMSMGGMAGALSNPLYDDAMLRLTPRQHFSAPAAEPPVTKTAVAAAAAAAQLPGKAAAARAVVPARAAAGQLPRVDEAASVLTAYAPGGLSVLYENQTMRVERVELKAELKLISARLAVLEARSKAWGRTVPAAAKGRSQSAPRGAPRHRQAPQRSAPAAAQAQEQARHSKLWSLTGPTLSSSPSRAIMMDLAALGTPGTSAKSSAAARAGRSLQRSGSVGPRTTSTDSMRAAVGQSLSTPKVPVRAARSVARSRPGSPARPAVHLAFGSRTVSRASSPTRPEIARTGAASRATSPVRPAFARTGAACRVSSPVRPAVARTGTASRRSSPARAAAGRLAGAAAAVPFGSRVCSPVKGPAAPRFAFGSRAGSPARSASAAKSASSSKGSDATTASSMPYRNAFMGGHASARRPRDASPGSSQGSRTAASASEGNAASRPPTHAGSVDSSLGPPPPRRSATACPSSEERWAGPGGRLGRTPLHGVEAKASAAKTRAVASVQHNKENAGTAEGTGKISRVALTAAKLGLTLDNAFKPRQARTLFSLAHITNMNVAAGNVSEA
ncbi:hypothetical protein COCSUDRAFT_55783 [Coccomyxa subellipsoidea C-169]|uniref:Uncharacterized protein n=1 Tax=Coccomyxa subellipsoidea (strain C-169) TaxID=574566 RepID=I0ZAY2_COCSC|nr:hypothetical protein COCSUDRAFT_55783 [Coccomyxa subellipsoidea C-169]EIE27801.1 hypothetical protein COCSUDRAFT_55783 [Coccomyxa subellipsoidea C-169]|eukprot:XP_005652345.1 hypothetical protein COCSUDRAFT_55783 [Coccomyxa subellipsoidea C-169]